MFNLVFQSDNSAFWLIGNEEIKKITCTRSLVAGENYDKCKFFFTHDVDIFVFFINSCES